MSMTFYNVPIEDYEAIQRIVTHLDANEALEDGLVFRLIRTGVRYQVIVSGQRPSRRVTIDEYVEPQPVIIPSFEVVRKGYPAKPPAPRPRLFDRLLGRA